MHSVLVAFFLLLLVGTSDAAVLIFKGTFSRKSLPAEAPTAGGAYFVYDTDSRQYAVIGFFKANGAKDRSHDQGICNAGTVPLPRGKAASVLSDAEAFANASFSRDSFLRLKGNNSTIVYNLQEQTMLFPALLSGTRTEATFTASATATEEMRLTLRFQPVITKEKQGTPFDETVMDIHVQLFQQGYGDNPIS